MLHVEMLTLIFLVLWMCVFSQDPGSKAVADRYAVYWNSSNPRFQRGDYHIDVCINDYLDVFCPHYEDSVPEDKTERYILYMVNFDGYSSCDHTSKGFKRWECNRPHSPNGPLKFSEKFQLFTPFSLGFEFRPGREYFYICHFPFANKGYDFRQAVLSLERGNLSEVSRSSHNQRTLPLQSFNNYFQEACQMFGSSKYGSMRSFHNIFRNSWVFLNVALKDHMKIHVFNLDPNNHINGALYPAGSSAIPDNGRRSCLKLKVFVRPANNCMKTIGVHDRVFDVNDKVENSLEPADDTVHESAEPSRGENAAQTPRISSRLLATLLFLLAMLLTL